MSTVSECPTCGAYHPENYKGDCRDDRHRANTPFRWFSTGSGRIEFQLCEEDAAIGSHPGPCDADIKELRQKHYIAEQLACIGPELLRSELKEYGAWDAAELADHDMNLTRLLWLACGDIQEESRT